MLLQEAGIAVGWPLGLGQDTTGWPLGLRLRLTQVDSQWAKEPQLENSPSYTSDSSSSLDTESEKSFFQDKSISLGTLIGLPIHHHHHHHHHHPQSQAAKGRPRGNRNRLLRVFPTASSCRRSSSDEQKPGQQSASSPDPASSHESNSPPRIPTPTSVVWNFLSVLNCTRLHLDDDSARSRSKPRCRSVSAAQAASSELAAPAPAPAPVLAASPAGAVGVGGENRTPSATGGVKRSLLSRSPPADKLYDNITYEEEKSDHDESQSSEWNPLFASWSLEDDDEMYVPNVVPESLQHVQALMRCSSTYSDSQESDWSSASESLDVRKSQDRQTDFHQFSKHSLISMLVSRMVCCRSTPTMDS